MLYINHVTGRDRIQPRIGNLSLKKCNFVSKVAFVRTTIVIVNIVKIHLSASSSDLLTYMFCILKLSYSKAVHTKLHVFYIYRM